MSGRYESCCVVVRNMQRCIFAVPTPSVFPPNELAEFEQSATAGGPTDKTALNFKLQVLIIPDLLKPIRLQNQ